MITAVVGFDAMTPAQRAWAVLDAIDADPQAWTQDVWLEQTPCGTAGCAAGTLTIMAGDMPDFGREPFVGEVTTWVMVGDAIVTVPDRAAELFGFASGEAMNDEAYQRGVDDTFPRKDDWDLFHALNTRDDLERIVTALFGVRP